VKQFTQYSTRRVNRKFYIRDDVHQSDGIRPTPYWFNDMSTEPERGAGDRISSLTFVRTVSGSRPYDEYTDDLFTGSSYEGVPSSPYSFLSNGNDAERYFPGVPQWVINQASSNLLDNLLGHKASLAVSLAEGGESVNLLVDTFKLTGRVVMAILRKRPNEVVKILKDHGDGSIARSIAKGTLAYNLGFRPLYGELSTLRENILTSLEQTPPVINGIGRFKTDVPIDSRYKYNHWWSTHTGNHFYEVVYRATLSPTPSYAHGLRTLGGVNPLSIAWELTPLSFVIDWFVGIGDFIAQLGSHVDLDFQYGAVSIYQDSKLRFQSDRFKELKIETIPGEINCKNFERKLLFSLPWPKIVRGSGLASASRVATASALASLVASKRGSS
jgi:hypothetical protein